MKYQKLASIIKLNKNNVIVSPKLKTQAEKKTSNIHIWHIKKINQLTLEKKEPQSSGARYHRVAT